MKHALNENAVADGPHGWGTNCQLQGEGRRPNLPSWAPLPSLASHPGLTTIHFFSLIHEISVVAFNFDLELITASQEVVLRVPPPRPPAPHGDIAPVYTEHMVQVMALPSAWCKLLRLRHWDFTRFGMHSFSLFITSLPIIQWHFIACINLYDLHHVKTQKHSVTTQKLVSFPLRDIRISTGHLALFGQSLLSVLKKTSTQTKSQLKILL